MPFVQIIDTRTSHPDEIRELGERMEKEMDGKGTLKRRIVTQDRNNPKRQIIMAFFDSYEDAMKNSNMPEIQQFSKEMSALLDGPPTFIDLDIVDDQTM